MMKIIYLYPQSTYKTELRSDTLWGILCWAIYYIYGKEKLEEILNSYNNQPKFIISSTFPFIETDNFKFHFFPKPLIAGDFNTNDKLSIEEKIILSRQRKKIKKLQFLELSDFENLINNPEEKNKIFNEIINTKNQFKIHIDYEATPHNTISRLSGGTLKKNNESGQLFHVDEYYIHFEPDKTQINKFKNTKCGLFFLVKGNIDEIEGALRFLNHIGYGGNKSIGKGTFLYKAEDFTIKEPTDYNAYTNLSLYYPKEHELNLFKNKNIFIYELVERQGFSYLNISKPSILMFAEGSVFPKIESNYFGQNILLLDKSKTNSHNIYQYGFGFMIKIKV